MSRMRRTKIAALGMFNAALSNATRWRPGTPCQAKYKRHFYDATIVCCKGESGRKFRVRFDDYSICAYVRVADLRERAVPRPLRSPKDDAPVADAENYAPTENEVPALPRHSNARNAQKRCREPPGAYNRNPELSA